MSEPLPHDPHGALLDLADMIGPVSHELLNVLNNIVLKSAVLARQVPDNLREPVAEFRTLANRASELLAGMQRARQGIPFPRQAVSLNEVVADVVAQSRQSIDIEAEVAPDLPPVWGNRVDTRRLVQLLIRMARTYAPAGPIRLCTERTASAVRLRVADPGPPVEAEHISAYFEPFGSVRPGQNILERAACQGIARRLEVKLGAEAEAMVVEFEAALS